MVQFSALWAGSAFIARRTAKLIANSDKGYLKVGVQLRGVSVISQGGREAKLGPGDFVLYDTSRPYRISGDGSFRMHTVMFARDSLRLSAPQLERLNTRRISGREGSGLLVTQYLTGLAQQLEADVSLGTWHLANATLDLLAASFAEQLACEKADFDSDKRSLLLRVQAYIEQRLGDPDLDVASIAAAHYVSIRSLQKLFADEEQTVTAWIRGQRMEHSRKDLGNPVLADEPVSSIAARWGLFDPAGFSRLFKSTYGLPPRDYRIKALAALRLHREANANTCRPKHHGVNMAVAQSS